MFPTINKKETGVNLRRIMDMRGVKPKDIQEYLGVWMCAECLSMVRCRESVIKPRKNKDIRGKTKICKIKLKCSWFAMGTSAAAPWPKASSPIWSTDSTSMLFSR